MEPSGAEPSWRRGERGLTVLDEYEGSNSVSGAWESVKGREVGDVCTLDRRLDVEEEERPKLNEENGGRIGMLSDVAGEIRDRATRARRERRIADESRIEMDVVGKTLAVIGFGLWERFGKSLIQGEQWRRGRARSTKGEEARKKGWACSLQLDACSRAKEETCSLQTAGPTRLKKPQRKRFSCDSDGRVRYHIRLRTLRRGCFGFLRRVDHDIKLSKIKLKLRHSTSSHPRSSSALDDADA